jgi:MinD-like ATPase involved in chromosome partitioning or flagellar assembly
MVETSKVGRAEIISVASGKGGTGKTLILASLGYALQVSGHRVLFVDTDTATNGLSLFILGPRGWETIPNLKFEDTFLGYLHKHGSAPSVVNDIIPFKANRGRQDDHGQIYDLLISGRGLYGDTQEEIDRPVESQITREMFQQSIRQLFEQLRSSGQWDYVLVDTRGGFGFNTTDVCALSDSFFVVTEADITSFYQDKNLYFRVAAAGKELDQKSILRGVVVNKATESLSRDNDAELGVRTLDLNGVEVNFRNVIVDAFSIRYEDTNPIPLDIDAVNAYKSHRLPYLAYPGSEFSYATLVAFSNLMRLATTQTQWTDESKKRWNALVDRVSEVIKSDNDLKRKRHREQQQLRDEWAELKKENRSLEAQLDELKQSFEHSRQNEQFRLERDSQYFTIQTYENRRRFFWTVLLGGVAAVVLALSFWLSYSNLRELSMQQQQALKEQIIRQDKVISDLQQRMEKMLSVPAPK